MDIFQEFKDDVVVLSLAGDVMGGPEAVRLNEEINKLLDEGKFKLVLNLEQVNRMNSSGLGILINALTTFKQNGGSLKLANLSNRIQHLLDVTKLNTVFESYESLEAALASF